MLRIHDILGRIRIRILGSMRLTNGSGFGSGSWIRILLFSTLTFKMPAKNLAVPDLKLVDPVSLVGEGPLHVGSEAAGLAAHLLPVRQLQLLLLILNLGTKIPYTLRFRFFRAITFNVPYNYSQSLLMCI